MTVTLKFSKVMPSSVQASGESSTAPSAKIPETISVPGTHAAGEARAALAAKTNAIAMSNFMVTS
jgi:hypothetical protein